MCYKTPVGNLLQDPVGNVLNFFASLANDYRKKLAHHLTSVLPLQILK